MGDVDRGKNPPPDGRSVQINEVLCWYQNMIGTIGETVLTELCCKKYKDGEIKAARDILYSAVISDTS